MREWLWDGAVFCYEMLQRDAASPRYDGEGVVALRQPKLRFGLALCEWPPQAAAMLSGNGIESAYADTSFLFWRCLTRSSTTAGSASVEVSPRLPGSSSAILRRMRRMILPERVFGSPGANWIWSGDAIGPMSLRTHATNSFRNSSLGSVPVIRVTYA